jgi:circadian clock protein KaiC
VSERKRPSGQRSDDHDDLSTPQQASSGRFDSTGVGNLDAVLGGGLVRGSLALIVGPPGSGKTTLANQLAFSVGRAGRRVVVVSAMSEPTSKLIAHLRTFGFYDDALVGDRIQYLSLEQYLTAGLASVGEALIDIARKARADLVVLDGFRGVRGADQDLQAARQFLYDIGSTLSVFGMTTVITSEADPRDPAFFPESTTADIIIGLHYDLVGVQQRRALEVIKMRGAQPLSGLHSIHLSREGLVIYPRLASRVATHTEASEPDAALVEQARKQVQERLARVSVGIPELDRLLGGGLTAGSTTLVVGSLGTGKTVLALHFAVAGLRAGEPTVFLGFRETLSQLLQKAGAFDLGREMLAGMRPSGIMTLQHWAPVELNPDIVADRLVATLDSVGARRLVIDSVIELEHAIREGGDPRRIDSYMASLVEALRQRNITAMFIREHDTTIATRMSLTPGAVAVLAENVLLLQHIEEGAALHRVLSVVKMRYSAHDAQLHEFTIQAPAGIQLLDAHSSLDDG